MFLMKKLINDPALAIDQMIQGIQYGHPELRRLGEVSALANPNSGRKVLLVSGGGSGHEPLDFGYIGPGLLDVAITGPIFTPPDSTAIVRAITALDSHHDYLFIVKNFQEDVQNFSAAATFLNADGYNVKVVLVSDDQSVDPKTRQTRGRGVAGTVLMFKLLGAAADKGATLTELAALAKAINDNLYTLGVALSGTETPGAQAPSFVLADDEVAYGVGIHGEPGYRNEPLESSELLARELVNKIRIAAQFATGQKLAVLINGLGGLPLMDQYVFTNDVVQLLTLEGLAPTFIKTGTYLTSYGMRGASVTVLRLQDDQWYDWLKRPVGGYGW
jgi:dihydroxyacetone kinase